jgi:hypothetical protein
MMPDMGIIIRQQHLKRQIILYHLMWISYRQTTIEPTQRRAQIPFGGILGLECKSEQSLSGERRCKLLTGETIDLKRLELFVSVC